MSTPVRRALYGRMASDTTLNTLLGTPAPGFTHSIYHQEAPAKAGFPFVIFQKQAGTPTEAMGDPSALESDIWLIKGVARDTTTDVVESIQSRIQTLMNDASLSISGNVLLYLRRQSDVEYPEDFDGEMYKHAGALYRLVTD
jgi:hypothetical protein